MLQDDIIKIIYDEAGVVAEVGPMAEAPLNNVDVTPYGGSDASFTFGAGKSGVPSVEFPRFQVEVRNTSQQAAWTTARLVRSKLRWYNGAVNGSNYLNIIQVGDLSEISEDGSIAYRVVASYEAKIG
jgi:hypothetical protein